MVNGVASRGDFYGSPRLVDFPVLTCEARIPATANSVSINGRPLKVSNSGAPLNRILVVGDTGCRVKGPTAFVQTAEGIAAGGDRPQDCTSEAAWPYNKLVARRPTSNMFAGRASTWRKAAASTSTRWQ